MRAKANQVFITRRKHNVIKLIFKGFLSFQVYFAEMITIFSTRNDCPMMKRIRCWRSTNCQRSSSHVAGCTWYDDWEPHDSTHLYIKMTCTKRIAYIYIQYWFADYITSQDYYLQVSVPACCNPVNCTALQMHARTMSLVMSLLASSRNKRQAN